MQENTNVNANGTNNEQPKAKPEKVKLSERIARAACDFEQKHPKVCKAASAVGEAVVFVGGTVAMSVVTFVTFDVLTRGEIFGILPCYKDKRDNYRPELDVTVDEPEATLETVGYGEETTEE